MIELVDASGDFFHEVPARFGQRHPARMALEQQDAKIAFEQLDVCADGGLANAKRVGRMADVQIFGYRQRLHQRCQGMREPSKAGIPHGR